MINLCQLANGFSQGPDAISTSLLDVELLDDFVEGAQDLHIPKLSVAVEVLVLLLFFSHAITSDQVLHDQ